MSCIATYEIKHVATFFVRVLEKVRGTTHSTCKSGGNMSLVPHQLTPMSPSQVVSEFSVATSPFSLGSSTSK
ncbi:hypothetical protein HOLleu_08437 [Holothuria leucospilota]|uniref:Uncharacterized protein n=1 Tax=Holothuria leucospilota TaxID=206669 RepID=A0A9Q1CI86_HOLLE|nr:hypothetical protein HOLleu_08437 [Holothuria leucospilota]